MGPACVTTVLMSLFVCIVQRVAGGNPCVREDFDDSFVCVCNSTYCDTVDPFVMPAKGSYAKYESSRSGKRLERSVGTLKPSLSIPGLAGLSRLVLTLNVSKTYQTIKGFGCAITDSASINILSLSPGAQENLLYSYFSEAGIEYNMLRVPVASCDFSIHVYSYDDWEGDFELKNFSLTDEDRNMKIPLIKRAMAISRKLISLFASSWAPPPWMKTNGAANGAGTLKGQAGDQYHQTWANYYVRFLDEYKKENLSFWALTAQNEPTAGFVPNYSFQCLGFTPKQQADFIAKDLGPALANSEHSGVKLIIGDDRRHIFPLWPKAVLSDPKAAQYIHGMGVHWYEEKTAPAISTLGLTHREYPEYFVLATEACNGAELGAERGVKLGSWERGNRYSDSIIENLNYHVTGWVDWNAALDMQGGPNWVKNFVDAPIIVVPEDDVFYKQPMYYHMGHFSKFIPEGSQRVGLDLDISLISPLRSVALVRPDGAAVLVVLNKTPGDVAFTISDPGLGVIDTVAPANSIQTYVWSRQ